MNKILLIIGAVVIVAVGGGVFYLVTRDSGDGAVTNTEVRTGEQADAGATKTACDVLTQEIAVQVLGEGAVKSELPPTADASTGDISVSNCLYEVEQGNDLLIANILVRGAKNAGAYETNRFGFNDTRDQGGFESDEPAESESIANLGDDAYYNPVFEQVNVLVNNGQYWIIASADGDKRMSSEALARAVVENL